MGDFTTVWRGSCSEFEGVASANASSGQCAHGAPLRNQELMVLRVLDKLKQIRDSGCLIMWHKHLILFSEILMEGRTKEGITGYARESRMIGNDDIY